MIRSVDLRLAVRLLFKDPKVTLSAIVALTLGIAVTTVMFSIVYGGAFRGLPFEDGDRIMRLNGTQVARGLSELDVSLHDFLDWREQQQSFEDLAAYYAGTVNISGGDRPERFNGAFVIGNTFELLRARPLLGRGISEEDDAPGAPPVVVLGHSVWQNRYAGDPEIVGRVLRVNGEQTTVVGVMGPRFGFPYQQELWVPMKVDPLKVKRGERPLEVVGRLADGVTLKRARADLDAVAQRLELTYPELNKGLGVRIKSFTQLSDDDVALFFCMGVTSFFVFLIACSNVSHLLLARALARTKELSIRSALGASRRVLVLQLFADGLLLSLIGSAFGLLLAFWGVELFSKRVLPGLNPQFWVRVEIDGDILLFVVGLIAVCSVAAGLWPALRASRIDLNHVLKQEHAASGDLRVGFVGKGIVVLEFVLSCVLLTGAGLTIRSVLNLQAVDLGFETEGIFTGRVGLPEAEYPGETERLLFFESVLEDLRAHPDVLAAAVTSDLPTEGSRGADFAVRGRSYPTREDYPRAWSIVVSEGFFEVFGAPVRQGRDFDERDRAGAQPAVLVNELLAGWIWPEDNALDQEIRLGRGEGSEPWRTVVGRVPDMKVTRLHDDRVATLYLPLAGNTRRFMSLVVKGRGGPEALQKILTERVAAHDPNLPVYQPRSMTAVVAEKTYALRVISTLFLIFGALALVLAAVGTYGVMSFSTRQRTTEFGIRAALGAGRGDIVRLVARDAMRQLLWGLVLGLPLAWLVSGLMAVWFYGVSRTDPLTLGGVVAILAGLSLTVSLTTARRAAALDPMKSLRLL